MSRMVTSALGFCLLVAAVPAFAGWSLTQVTTTRGDRDAQDRGTTQRVWMDGSAAKLEVVGTANLMMEPGSYLLVQEGGKKIFLVNPQRKTYARVDPMAMKQGMEAMGGSGMEAKIEDPRMEKVVEEPGGEMLGRPTTHYRFHTTYTMVVSMSMGMKTSMATDILEDVWTTPAAAGGGVSQTLGDVAGGPAVPPELQRLAQTVKATLSGLPLKQVTVTTSKSSTKGSGMMGLLARRAGGAGGDRSVTTTMVVKDLVEAALPASTFQIPPGYAETEMMQRGPAMPDLGEGGH